MNYTHEQIFQNSRWLYTVTVQTTHSRWQFVYKFVVVVEENGLLQNGEGLNGAAYALPDGIIKQIQCCVLYLYEIHTQAHTQTHCRPGTKTV